RTRQCPARAWSPTTTRTSRARSGSPRSPSDALDRMGPSGHPLDRMRSRRRRDAVRRPPRWLWLVQLLCVLAGLHLSGAAHGIAELVGGPDVDCGELCATPCELES